MGFTDFADLDQPLENLRNLEIGSKSAIPAIKLKQIADYMIY